jgi:hypothetical protein
MDPVSKAQRSSPEGRPESRFKGRGKATQFKPGQSGNPGGTSQVKYLPKIDNQGSQKLAPDEITPEQALENRLDELILAASELTGVKSIDVADRIIHQVGTGLVNPKPRGGDNAILVKAFEAIGEMAPKGPVQSMLAAQMIATNEASAKFLACAFVEGQTPEGRTASVSRAARLMQLFLLQVEAFEKLRGKSVQQKVVVEHVHVHEGGQAIVGTVTAREPG